ncbi:MAG: glycosyltransferase family 1 protein [Chitinophagaceae bacterium]|nr:MAG: glycosyltransferase family 1 protein [Chitinophagaceae bacterium]
MTDKKLFIIVNVDWFFLSHRLPLARVLKEKGYDVFILTKNTGYKTEIESYGLHFININFERSGKNIFKELAIIKNLVFLFRKYQPDITHNVTIKPAIYASIALKFYKRKSMKCINAISGLGYNFTSERSGILQKLLKKMMVFAYKGPIYFIFQNPDDETLYKKLGVLNNHNYRIIKGSGVDSEDFLYIEPQKKERVIIVFLARMLVDKGVYEYIGAANLLLSKMRDKAKFLLIGDIDEENLASLSKKELESTEVPGYIEWKGFTKNVKGVYEEADIVCLPSYREGLPKSLVEAMAIGRPIVTTDVPGCRECVQNGVNGFLVPVKSAASLAEALEKLIIDPELRLKMGKASREKMLTELSLKQVLTETLAYYEQI